MRSTFWRQSSTYWAKRYSSVRAPMNFLRGRLLYSSMLRAIWPSSRAIARALLARSRPETLGGASGAGGVGSLRLGCGRRGLLALQLRHHLALLRLELGDAALRLDQAVAVLGLPRHRQRRGGAAVFVGVAAAVEVGLGLGLGVWSAGVALLLLTRMTSRARSVGVRQGVGEGEVDRQQDGVQQQRGADGQAEVAALGIHGRRRRQRTLRVVSGARDSCGQR